MLYLQEFTTEIRFHEEKAKKKTLSGKFLAKYIRKFSFRAIHALEVGRV